MNLVIMQARMGSSRLPGKVLKQVCGKTLLELQYERIQQASYVDRIIIATTSEPLDDVIEQLCQSQSMECFRGSESDVLDRYYQAVRQANCLPGDAIIRVTADCPLLDPAVLDQVVGIFQENGVDYASNTIPPSYPDGLDVEVFRLEALEQTWREAKLHSEREHVTPYLRNHTELFSRVNLSYKIDLSHLRWTVDEPEDFEMVRIVYESLYPSKRYFLMEDVLTLMDEKPYLLEMNKKFKRNEGYEKSLIEDIANNL